MFLHLPMYFASPVKAGVQGICTPAHCLNLRISPHSIRMRENEDQNNYEYGYFLRSDSYKHDNLWYGILDRILWVKLLAIFFLPGNLFRCSSDV